MSSRESIDKISKSITSLCSDLGSLITICAHHYQNSAITYHADLIGDSYQLARDCQNIKSGFIVFCGVKFMADTARILCPEQQTILLPELSAGCPLAQTIDLKTALAAFREINKIQEKPVIPIVYINSEVELKSFAGNNEGCVCTSSNAQQIIRYYLDQNRAILFIPDFNLGYNTAINAGFSVNDICSVSRRNDQIQLSSHNRAKIYLWKGSCYVHKRFSASQISSLRKQYPGIKIISHPETDYEVVMNSDYSGSTSFIKQTIEQAPSGSIWAIATETTFVKRLAAENPDKQIYSLTDSPCSDMQKITPEKLLTTLQNIFQHEQDGLKLQNTVELEANIVKSARNALLRMITITESK